MPPPFVDIHCHLLPGVDDGAADLTAALEMAEMAAADGASTIIATPHQLGAFGRNRGDDIRRRTAELQQHLDAAGVPLTLLPGADVRIEDGLVEAIAAGAVLTLGDHRRHVLLELPHELYLPIQPLLDSLQRSGVVGVLSHPERNAGLLRQPALIAELVAGGCLMQVTAGSFLGAFGPPCQSLAEWMISEGLIHFVATDAHGPQSRRPLMRRAFERVAELAGTAAAEDLCCHHPVRVAAGADVPAGRRPIAKKSAWQRALTWKKAG